MASPPFTTHAIAFETELMEKAEEPIDLDEVFLDVARYPMLDMEEALVEFIRKRQSKWQPDLVVPIGSPAGVFVAQYRDRLFPKETPVIYTGMGKRRLPEGALEQNAAFVGDSVDFQDWFRDILHLAPETTEVAVVLGASPLERYWTDVIQQDCRPFTNRVHFTWFNDLSFDQMLHRAARMPPNSFILLVLLMRDASGVSHNADEALKRLHDVANAPINSLFEHHLGLGIVGGRLYPAGLEGVESARIAVRVLQGEAATNFPPKIIGTLPPTYDWRELRRWNISEEQLPSGSRVLFRQPTVWDRYKGRIIAIFSVCAIEAVLILLLLANLVERRRAERSLSETAERFRSAANAAPVMVWTAGTDKLCTFVNKRWLEFTGRSPEQELGNGWAEVLHPEDSSPSVKTYEQAFDARQEFAMEYRLRKHDGSYAWVLARGVPRFAESGEFLGYIGTASDITTLKQAEERWRTMVESAPNAMLVVDASEKITLANVRTERIFGYTVSELIGKPVEMLIPKESHANNGSNGHSLFASALLGTAELHNKEVAGRHRNGTAVPLEIGLNSVKTQNGQIVLVSIIDITQRLAAEAGLRESEKRMTMAAEAAHLGMLVWDSDQSYLWTSTEWKTIHGYAADEKVRFDSLIDRVHPDDRDAVGRVVMDAFTQQRSFFIEHRVVLPDGQVRWISKSGRVEQVGSNGPLRLLGISIDITDRKEAEEAAREVSGRLINAQEDERRRIARDLHDDLNQRLAMLSVEADLLGQMEHKPEARPLIEDIASRVRGLSTEVHKLSYQLHPAKLEQLGLVTAARSLCQEQGRLWSIPVEFTHDGIPRDLNRGAALCIFRIIQESLQNIGKHSHSTHACVELKKEGDEIRLVISDNGVGFDMAMAIRHGGLGLVGMRERVRFAHGQVAFRSDPGRGTRVEVRIPVSLEELVSS
ncbi:MAG TPA: PAS domain S-box protein [Verrucomicrobiae bacterium]|nr:PAS domain S-box protein [Verrucomicrobiae bacterium]